MSAAGKAYVLGFSTIPKGSVPPDHSWWVQPMTREEFAKAAADRLPLMRGSYGDRTIVARRELAAIT